MFPFDALPDPKAVAGTLFLRLFGLRKIPLVLFVRPSVVSWTQESFVLRIPLLRRTRNQNGSMYFGAISIGADLTPGCLALAAIRASKEPVSLVFKTVRGEFLKRAEGDVLFTCDDGILIADLVQKAIETGERVEADVQVVATVPTKLDGPVARFTLTMSLKHLGTPASQRKKTTRAKTSKQNTKRRPQAAAS